jgi:hypothetical protein
VLVANGVKDVMVPAEQALQLLERRQTRSWFSTQTPGTRSYSSTPKSSLKKHWHS